MSDSSDERAGRDGGTLDEGNSGSAAKVLRVLTSFTPARPRMNAETISVRTGLPLSSTYRYIAVLRRAGLLEGDGTGSLYLSAAAVSLGEAAKTAHPLQDVAKPIMDRLAETSGEAVVLLRRSGDRAICIARSESAHPIRMTFDIGTAVPLHRGAGPKLLLAYLPDSERATLVDRLLQTDASKRLSRDSLMLELDAIRARGWADSHAEIQFDVYAVAAPIWTGGRLSAAISIVGPAYRLPRSRRDDFVSEIVDAAERISAVLMGGPSPIRANF